MQKNVIADGMKNETPRNPRDFTAARRGTVADHYPNLPVDAALAADTLRQLKPRAKGTLDGVNALWQWRQAVGAFVQLYAANYKTFDQRRFRAAANYFEPEPGGNLS
jgi:hypothetical protein